MTRAQLRTLLKRRLGNRTDLTDTDGGDLDLYLDNAILDLATSRVTLRSLEQAGASISTEAGVSRYVVGNPATGTTMAVLYIEDTTNKRVLSRYPGGFEEFLQARQSAQNDKPAQFAEFGDSIYLNPPDAIYSLQPYFYLRPSIGAGGAGTPNIEAEWHYPIVLVAAAMAFRDLGDIEIANNVEQELQAWGGRRDTSRRIAARFDRPTRGVQPASAWLPGRLGI